MKTFRDYFFIGCLLLLAGMGWEQAYGTNFKASLSNYQFRHITSSDGLSCNHVLCMLEDSRGYMWFGTEYGLNRFDGYRFRKFFKKDVPYSIDNISNLVEDSWGNIWIDMGRFVVYDWETDTFTEAKHVLDEMGISCTNLQEVFVDNQKNLWIEADHKLYYFQSDKSFKAYPLPFSTDVENLTKVDSQVYLTTAYAWYKLDIHSGVFAEQEQPKDIEGQVNEKRILCTYADKSNDLWIDSKEENKLWRKRYYSDELEPIEIPSASNNYRIQDIVDDNNGNIWIATDHQGVFILEKNSGQFFNEKNDRLNLSSLSSSNIVRLYLDSNNILWMAHFRSGISYLTRHSKRIQKADLGMECSVAKIMEDTQTNLWLGTDGEGVLRQKDTHWYETVDGIPSKSITALYEDSRHRIWAGTYLEGLYCNDHGKISHFTTENTNLPDNNIWDIKEDRFKNIWLASIRRGVCRFDAETHEAVPAFEDIPAIGCSFQLHYDQKDSLFAATNAGIGILNVKTMQDTVYLTNRAGTQSFRHDFVRTVYRDSRGWLWMGFAGELVIWNLKTDQFLFIEEKDGLCNNLINGITEDKNHHIWVSTAHGISNIIIRQDGANVGNPIVHIQNYTTNDGLLDNDCEYMICRKDGSLAVCSQNGYTIISPTIITDEDYQRKPVFTEVLVDNKPVFYPQSTNHKDCDIKVSAGFWPQNHLIRIGFSTLDFNNLHRQKYAYQIEGQMKDWIETDESYILLNQLKSGEYKLKVKACNANGVWGNEYSTIHLHILPPFWMTPTAYLIYALVIIACLYGTGKHFYNKREKKLLLIRQEQETKKQMELYNMKMSFLTNISHDIRTPLSLILSPLESLKEETKNNESVHHKIEIAYHNAHYLLELINQLLNFRKLEAHAETLHLVSGNIVNFIKEICNSYKNYADKNLRNLSFQSDLEYFRMKFDKEKVNRIMYNLLSNATKFTDKNGHIWVDVSKDDHNLYIRVSDDGIGIAEADKGKIFQPFFQVKQKDVNNGSGIGLHITAEYLKLCGGSISVEPNHPKGSRFICRIPIVEEEEAKAQEKKDELTAATQNSALPKVLLVEDNVEFINFLSECLSKKYRVLKAEDGEQALDILKETEDIDIIISDVMMPKIDGIRLCNIVKTDLKWSHIPVILLTARTAEEHMLEGLENGADDYMTKPFNMNMLQLRIQKFLDWKAKCQRDLVQKTDIQPKDITISSVDEQFMLRAMELMEANMANAEYSVENFSQDMNVSRANLYRKMIAITGKSPIEYMRIIRLKRSKQLLMNGYRINETAYDVGFNNPKYFRKYFKEEFGITPAEFLKKRQEHQP